MRSYLIDRERERQRERQRVLERVRQSHQVRCYGDMKRDRLSVYILSLLLLLSLFLLLSLLLLSLLQLFKRLRVRVRE
jgi:hypothetical protein